MPRNRILPRLTLFTLFAFLLACSPQAKKVPNIIVILIDDMRWDEFGASANLLAQMKNELTWRRWSAAADKR